MKRAIYIILILVSIKYAPAQDPDFAKDFIHNPALLNPAYSAKQKCITFNVLNNLEWIYPDAPKRGSFWFGANFEKMGLGLHIGYKTIGAYYTMDMSGSYFYNIPLSRYSDLFLAMGVSGGIFQDYLNTGVLNTQDPDPILQDQSVLSRFYPQLAVGSMIYNDIFEFGISGSRLLPNSGYMFLNHNMKLPPVVIIHGKYYYKQPFRRHFATFDGVAFVSKDEIFTRTDVLYYIKKNVKLGGGLGSSYYPNIKSLKINLYFASGLRINDNLYITYELTVNSLNQPIPAIAKIGNSISLHYDFYKYDAYVPEFF